MIESVAPHDLLTDDDVSSSCALLVVGCGNLLRGDDAVGPIAVRHIWDGGVPDDVRLVDGGTAGMDIAFQMRGAKRVILIDAAMTGSRPGTVYKIPGPEVEDLPPLSGLHTHSFRWDNALAFARWLLGNDYPDDVTVYLIEAESVTPGGELTPDVRDAMLRVLELIRAEPVFARSALKTVEFTEDGYLQLNHSLARQHFPGDAAVLVARTDELWLIPLRGSASGGLLLKQRNAAGDRSLLVLGALPDESGPPIGERRAIWDEIQGALRIDRYAARC